MVKEKNPDAVTVFIGPCIAKKSEVKEHSIEGNADYALTYGEIRAIMRAKEIELRPEENTLQEGSVYGKRFANAGGVTSAVLESMKEAELLGDDISELKVCQCNGAAECKKALLMLKAGRLQEDFIEGMACEGGCVGGPSKHKTEMESKKNRDNLIAMADDRSIKDNIQKMSADKINVYK